MEQLFVELAKQVPSILVLGWIVWKFLQHLERRDAVLQHLGDDCHAVQHKAIEAINENSKVLGVVGARLADLGKERGAA